MPIKGKMLEELLETKRIIVDPRPLPVVNGVTPNLYRANLFGTDIRVTVNIRDYECVHSLEYDGKPVYRLVEDIE